MADPVVRLVLMIEQAGPIYPDAWRDQPPGTPENAPLLARSAGLVLFMASARPITSFRVCALVR